MMRFGVDWSQAAYQPVSARGLRLGTPPRARLPRDGTPPSPPTFVSKADLKTAASAEGDTWRDGGLLTSGSGPRGGAIVASWLLVGECDEGDYYVVDATPASGRGSYGGYRILTRVHYEQGTLAIPTHCSQTVSVAYEVKFWRRQDDVTISLPGNPERSFTLDFDPLVKLGEMQITVSATMKNHCGTEAEYTVEWEITDGDGAVVDSDGIGGEYVAYDCAAFANQLFLLMKLALGYAASDLEQLEADAGDLVGGDAVSITGAETNPTWTKAFTACLSDVAEWCDDCCSRGRVGPGPGGFPPGIDIPSPGDVDIGEILNP